MLRSFTVVLVVAFSVLLPLTGCVDAGPDDAEGDLSGGKADEFSASEGSLGGRVFYNARGWANIDLSLTGALEDETRSDGSGYYSFENLPDGEYTIAIRDQSFIVQVKGSTSKNIYYSDL